MLTHTLLILTLARSPDEVEGVRGGEVGVGLDRAHDSALRSLRTYSRTL